MIEFITSEKIYLPIIYIGISIVLYIIISKLVNKIIKVPYKHINYKKQETVASLIKSIIKYIVIIITIILILNVYGVNTTSILASLGVVGLVVGLSFQDMLKNLLAGVSIIFDNRYSVGDNIQINNFRGSVVELGLQTTKIKAYTGEIFSINNSLITSVINYSASNSKLVLDINVSYDTDLKKLDKVIKSITSKIASLDNILGEVEILGLDAIDNSTIIYKLAVDCKPETNSGVKRQVLRIVKEEFDKNGIIIPGNNFEIITKK